MLQRKNRNILRWGRMREYVRHDDAAVHAQNKRDGKTLEDDSWERPGGERREWEEWGRATSWKGRPWPVRSPAPGAFQYRWAFSRCSSHLRTAISMLTDRRGICDITDWEWDWSIGKGLRPLSYRLTRLRQTCWVREDLLIRTKIQKYFAKRHLEQRVQHDYNV